MSADFILIIDGAFLDRASADIFPAVRQALTIRESVPELKVTATISIDEAPRFQLSGLGGGQMFALLTSVDLRVEMEAGAPQAVKIAVDATCRATVDGRGRVDFGLVELAFATGDPFLRQVLQAKKPAIMTRINGYVSAIALDLAIVKDVTFAGYAILLGGGRAVLAGGLGTPVQIGQLPSLSTDFAAQLSEDLVKQFIQNSFWSTLDKSYDAHGARVNINGYDAWVGNGQIHLALHLGGTFSIGAADWDISIDTVSVTVGLGVNDQRQLVIANGSVSRPGVSLHPSNWEAWLATIGTALIGAVTEAILNEVIAGKIQDAVNSKLSGVLMTLPAPSGSIGGVTVTVVPTNLAVAGAGNQLLLTGSGQVLASGA